MALLESNALERTSRIGDDRRRRRRKDPLKMTTVRIPVWVMESIEDYAEDRGGTFSQELRNILTAWATGKDLGGGNGE